MVHHRRVHSDTDYEYTYECKRPKCTRLASYGYRGLCQFHYRANRNEMLNSGQLLGVGRVPAAPVAEHIDMLLQRMTIGAIGYYSGLPTVTLWRIHRGQKTVQADTAGRVMGIEL